MNNNDDEIVVTDCYGECTSEELAIIESYGQVVTVCVGCGAVRYEETANDM